MGDGKRTAGYLNVMHTQHVLFVSNGNGIKKNRERKKCVWGKELFG